MSDEKQTPDLEPNPEAAKAPANESGDPIAEVEALEAQLAAREEELGQMKDRLMRAMADMENLRRRAEREKADAQAYAATQFARDMLDVSDNLRRALGAVPAELKDNAQVKSLIDGVEMTERSLLQAFERHGIQEIKPEGEKFDPNLHQAMFEVETAEAEPGHVMQVVQAGYVIKDRLLRPAMVGVSKSPKEDRKSSGIDETV